MARSLWFVQGSPLSLEIDVLTSGTVEDILEGLKVYTRLVFGGVLHTVGDTSIFRTFSNAVSHSQVPLWLRGGGPVLSAADAAAVPVRGPRAR